jgi:hypothetical protein
VTKRGADLFTTSVFPGSTIRPISAYARKQPPAALRGLWQLGRIIFPPHSAISWPSLSCLVSCDRIANNAHAFPPLTDKRADLTSTIGLDMVSNGPMVPKPGNPRSSLELVLTDVDLALGRHTSHRHHGLVHMVENADAVLGRLLIIIRSPVSQYIPSQSI